MTLNDEDNNKCAFHSSDRGCCCATKMILIPGDKFEAEVYEDGQSVLSHPIDVIATIKPQTPFINSVEPSNGMYYVKWQSNAKSSIRNDIWADVTYHKKGSYNKTSESVKPSTLKDGNEFPIPGHNLEPSTTYVVSVRTYTNFGVFSDSSNKVEFTTASSTNGRVIAIILGLSVVAVVFSALAFACVVKFKGQYWDKAAKDEKPRLLDFKPNKEVIMTPESLPVHSLSVEPLIPKDSLIFSKESLSDTSGRSGQTSGISTASSSLDYANTQPIDMEECVLEALRNAFPIFTPAEDTFLLEEPMQGSTITPPPVTTSFTNETYFSTKNNPADDLDLPMTCDVGYHSSEGPALQNFMILPPDPAVMDTDMSYQPCVQSGEASGDSQNLLPVVYGYQGCEKIFKLSNNMNSVEKAEDSQSSVLDLINSTNTEITTDYGYHCV